MRDSQAGSQESKDIWHLRLQADQVFRKWTGRGAHISALESGKIERYSIGKRQGLIFNAGFLPCLRPPKMAKVPEVWAHALHARVLPSDPVPLVSIMVVPAHSSPPLHFCNQPMDRISYDTVDSLARIKIDMGLVVPNATLCLRYRGIMREQAAAHGEQQCRPGSARRRRKPRGIHQLTPGPRAPLQEAHTDKCRQRDGRERPQIQDNEGSLLDVGLLMCSRCKRQQYERGPVLGSSAMLKHYSALRI